MREMQVLASGLARAMTGDRPVIGAAVADVAAATSPPLCEYFHKLDINARWTNPLRGSRVI
jgi:hypothetical protein